LKNKYRFSVAITVIGWRTKNPSSSHPFSLLSSLRFCFCYFSLLFSSLLSFSLVFLPLFLVFLLRRFFSSLLFSLDVIEMITHSSSRERERMRDKHSVTHTDYTYRFAVSLVRKNMIMKNAGSTSILFQLDDLELIVCYSFSLVFFFFFFFYSFFCDC